MKGQVFIGGKQLEATDCEFSIGDPPPPALRFSAVMPKSREYRIGQTFRASYKLRGRPFSHDVKVNSVDGDLVEFEAQ